MLLTAKSRACAYLAKHLILMRLYATFLSILCLTISATSLSQGVSLNLDRAPIKKAFAEITLQTGTPFLFTEQLINASSPVTVALTNVSLERALDACLLHQPLRWEMINQTIVITKKIMIPSAPDTLRHITGFIHNYGSPVTGASVMILATDKGTYTKDDGSFTLQISPSENILLITSVGYESQEVTIGKRSFIDISLSSMINKLDEAVVIAYGTTTRRQNLGAISKVSSKEISSQPVSNPLAAIAGRMSGVFISQQTGVPGGGFNIQIRGKNSLRDEGNAPLYIINGVPISATTLSASVVSVQITQSGNPLSAINPNDIESVEILKDADATAIYGSRGANGVVMITTKKGSTEKTHVDVNYNEGAGAPASIFSLLNAQQYLQMRTEAFANDHADPGESDYDLNGTWNQNRSTDWQQELLGHSAHQRNLQVGLQAGNENTHVLLSGGYNHQGTVFPGHFAYERLSANLNVNHHSANNKFDLSVNTLVSHEKSNLPKADLLFYALTLPPTAPEIYNVDGKLNWENSTWLNPFAELLKKYAANTTNLIHNIQIGYHLTPELELKTSVGYTYTSLEESTTTPASSFRPSFGITTGSAFFNDGHTESLIVEPQIDFRKAYDWGKLQVLLGGTAQKSLRDLETIRARGFTNDNQLLNKQAAPNISIYDLQHLIYRYAGAFARINYSYQDKYLLNLTGRRDGSSRFAPANQFGNFGSVAVGWNFSREKWFRQGIPAISFGKVRMSYGSAGNDQIGDYQYFNTHSTLPNPFQGIVGLYPSRLYNPHFQWEVNKKWEAAVELGLFKDRLLMTVTHYRNRSSNQLVGLFLAPTTGFKSVQANLPATVRNTGIEIDANAFVVKKTSFSWSTAVNFSWPSNKLVAFPNLAGSSFANVYAEGYSLDLRKLLHVTQVDPTTGIYTFADEDGNGSGLDYPQDLQTFKKIGPRMFAGWQHSLRWKQFELDFLIQYVEQTGASYITGFDMPGSLSNQPAHVLDRWQKPGDQTPVQRFTTGIDGDASLAYTYASTLSDVYIVDASYIRLKNISLSYHLPSIWLKKAGMTDCRFYAEAQNFLTITSYHGYDPENNGTGNLPPLKMIVGGLHITL